MQQRTAKLGNTKHTKQNKNTHHHVHVGAVTQARARDVVMNQKNNTTAEDGAANLEHSVPRKTHTQK